MGRTNQRPRTQPPSPAAHRTGWLARISAAWRTIAPPRSEWYAARYAFLYAVVSALLLRMAFKPLYLSPLAFVALVPLFWGLRRCKPAMAFYVGLVFSTIMALFGVHWFTVVDKFNSLVWFGILPLAIYIGCYMAAALALIVYFARKLPPWAALGAAMMAWAGVEYWMSIGPLGMPYGVAQSQTGWLSMAKVASLAGMPLLSALIVGFNLAAMEVAAAFVGRFGQAEALARLGVMTTLAVLGVIYGGMSIAAIERDLEEGETARVRLALLQPNIDQVMKYNSYRSEDAKERQRLQNEMNRIQFEQLRSIEADSFDLVVTPESTFTADFIDIEEYVQDRLYGGAVMIETLEIARDINAPIVIGGIDFTFLDWDGNETESSVDAEGRFHETDGVYGGLWVINPEDEGIQYRADYRKRQLMPFGEAVPYLSVIPGFQENIVQVGTFDRGDLRDPVGIWAEQPDGTRAEIRLGPSICFEDQFPYIHRHFAARDANLFLNTTNDGWFDGSAGPGWHAEMARWRSIETGIPMVRCTNTGITMVIGPTGKILEKIPAAERNILKTEITIRTTPPRTLYTRIGSLFGILCLLGTIATWISLLRRRS